jgi:hypothetical protein
MEVGFQVKDGKRFYFYGPRIHPREEDAKENLARYIIRASFSQERMTYIREESKVIYKSKHGRQQKPLMP